MACSATEKHVNRAIKVLNKTNKYVAKKCKHRNKKKNLSNVPTSSTSSNLLQEIV